MPRSYLFILSVVFFGFGLTARAGQAPQPPQPPQERPPLGAAVTVGPLARFPRPATSSRCSIRSSLT
jgi:hypothetical protein